MKEKERDKGEPWCVHEPTVCRHSLLGPEAWVLSLPIISSLSSFPSLLSDADRKIMTFAPRGGLLPCQDHQIGGKGQKAGRAFLKKK